MLYLFACNDAPRNNILDPQNVKFNPPPEAPVIDSLYFYSAVGIGGRNKINLYLIVYIDDSKNPIEELSVTNNLNRETVRLNYIAEEEKYEYTFTNTNLGIDIPDQVIGHSFDLYAVDRANNKIEIDKLEIKRIIKDNVYLMSPGTRDTVDTRPDLKWESDFDDQGPIEKDELDKIYHFKVEILNENLETIWLKNNLSIKIKELTVDQDLASGEYRWRVWIIDYFRNSVTTQQRKFVVR